MHSILKFFLILFFALTSLSPFASAAHSDSVYVDVLYLKNGDVIQGDMGKTNFDSLLRIRKWTGAIKTFAAEEVDSLVREGLAVPENFSRRVPFLAGLCSYLLPGGGQYYNREYERGLAFTAVSIGGVVLMVRSLEANKDELFFVGYGMFLGSWAVSMVDAFNRASYLNWLYLGENTSSHFSRRTGACRNWSLRPDLISSGINKHSIGRHIAAAPGLSLRLNF